MTYYLLLDAGAEAVGEQGGHYYPPFACNEGDDAGYFTIPEESGGDAADVGPWALGLPGEVL